MTNEDISFVLPSDYKQLGNSYSKKEYIYDFSFRVYINTIDAIKKIEVYKNGEKYEDVIVNNVGNNYFFIKDMNIVNKGNHHYGIKVTLNDGKVYKNGFYLKIQNSYIKNDIKILHFSTQGTHENFNSLNVLLKIETEYNVHSIKLYKKYVNRDWIYLGEMKQATYNYIYKDLLFDISLVQSNILFYKVEILTSNGLKKEAALEVPISKSTFSLNNISYLGNTYSDYTIYGGLVGRIISPQSEFNNDIFELVVDSSNNKYLKIDIDSKKYVFYSENFKIEYPDHFVSEQTKEQQNIFHLSGKGIVKQIISKEKDIVKHDSCEFNMVIKCGDDYSVIFNIHPDTDYSLNLSTEETLNNIVRYKDLYLNSTNDFNDKTISNVKYNGIFVYDENFSFFNVNSFSKQMIPIDNSRIDNLLKNSDFTTYNNRNFYFINYSSDGINVIVFDGINFDEYTHELELYEPTLEYIKNNICFKFDKNNKLKIEFINFDLTKNFEIVRLQDNTLQIINCNENISNIFNELRMKLLGKLNEHYSFSYDNKEEKAKFSKNYLLKEQIFESMNFDNFVQNMYMYIFRVVISTTAEVNGIEKNSELSIQATVNIGQNFYDIEKVDINYKIGDFDSNQESYNQKPIGIMEELNNTYYIKLDNSLRTKNKNDYGHYMLCQLFRQNALIYKFNLSDITDENFFNYQDMCKTRVVSISNNEIYILNYKNNEYIVNCIDLSTNSNKKHFSLKSNISCQYMTSLNDEQLQCFSNILSIAKQNEFVDRKMKIYSISDYDNVLMYDSGKEIFFNKIISISTSQNYNSFLYEYNVNYPLNIKNKNAFLQELEINAKNNL